MKAVIITDLDGTLIDDGTYSPAAAEPAIRKVKAARIPICICSSKSRSEIVHYRKLLGIVDPFISENGGGVFIPVGYFLSEQVKSNRPGAFEIIELGMTYPALVAALREVREKTHVRLRGFHEISAEEVASRSGLTLEMARMALERDYDEPFWIEEDPKQIESVAAALQERGLHVTRGGRFHHVMGNNDKGKAVDILCRRFRRHFPDSVFVGLGDSPNDIPMLERVDIPILVRRPSGDYDDQTRSAVRDIRLANGIGPAGWNDAVNTLILEWER